MSNPSSHSTVRAARRATQGFFLITGIAAASWAAMVPFAKVRLGLDEANLGVVLLFMGIGSVGAMPLAGFFIHRFGHRGVVALSALVVSLALPLLALAPSTPAMIAALIVFGASIGALDVAMNAHAARVEEGYGRPIFAGFHAFWNIGGLAGSGVDALMEALRVPVSVHFPIAGAVLLALALWGRALFLSGADRGQGEAAFAWPGRALVPLGVIAFCGFVAEGAVNSWSAVYLADVTGATPALASLGYFAFSGTMIAVRLVADRVVARTGAVRFVRVATTVAVLGFAVVLLVPWPVAVVFGFAVVGLGVAGIVPIAWSVASRKQADAPGKAVAAVAACGYLGFLVEPVLVGALATRIGLHWALSSAVVVTFGILFLAPSLRVREAALTR